MIEENISKDVFLKTWTGGYRENWAVYGAMTERITGKFITEEEVIEKCLNPFYNPDHVILEVGCGLAFWTDCYLAEHFKKVIAIDILPKDDFWKCELKNFAKIDYIELPDRDFTCKGVASDSIDFVWSFGVFCHLTLEANQEYLNNIFRVCKKGAKVALYYSNNDRRPHYKDDIQPPIDPKEPMWCNNNYKKTEAMLMKAGFKDIYDLMPELPDTMICGTKI